MEEKFYYSSSQLATIIQNISLTLFVIGLIVGVIACTENIVIGISVVVGVIIFFLLLYSLGEIIKLLHDIRENTEHLRDRIEER